MQQVEWGSVMQPSILSVAASQQLKHVKTDWVSMSYFKHLGLVVSEKMNFENCILETHFLML